MQKTLENHQKSHPKSMPKPSKNHEKNDAEKKLKNERPPQSTPGNPGDPRAPVRVTTYRKTTKGRQPEGEEFREENAERPTSTL